MHMTVYSGEWTIRSKDHSILFTVHYVLFIGKTVVHDSIIRFCVSPKGILYTGSIKATIGLRVIII